jgi:tRNA-specific 2-thiouridylase
MTAVVGMSGGVDSSTAAALLKEAGGEVIGLSLVLFEKGAAPSPTACCSLAAVDEAARTAEAIGIRHERLDARDMFMEKVIGPFAEAYARGRTPNPCVLCNRHVKFPLLLGKAQERGASLIATGHYARVEREGGGARLKRSLDPAKDQSYFLYALSPGELEALALPLGTWKKDDVREKARALGLPVFSRPESQEICFVGEEGYAPMVSGLHSGVETPGPIIDTSGRVLGEHRGIIHYTMGQRKGLGIAHPVPLYVIEVDAGSNSVVVGPRDLTYRSEITVEDVNWLAPRPESAFSADVMVRSTAPGIKANVTPVEDGATVVFDEPVFAPAPGQSAVFFDGDTLIGGGEIAS